MFEPIEIAWQHWVGFIVCVLFFLALDLGVFHKHAHVVKFKEALRWTALWFAMAMAFAVLLVFKRGREEAIEFVTGYIIELSLSMDNVFVIALIFTYFRVPTQYQHRVLFWGILGALIMRGLMIGLGAALIAWAQWLLYVFGGFLVVSGIKMLLSKDEEVHPEKNPLLRLMKKFFPFTHEYHGQRFAVVVDGQRKMTPLVLVLLMVETTDLIFALDSIPAIFAVTQKTFIVFTSNVFAILGLRSLYFVLAGAIEYFRYLKQGLSAVLVFIGLKMLVVDWVHIRAGWSLAVVVGILLVAMGASVFAAWRERRHRGNDARSA